LGGQYLSAEGIQKVYHLHIYINVLVF